MLSELERQLEAAIEAGEMARAKGLLAVVQQLRELGGGGGGGRGD